MLAENTVNTGFQALAVHRTTTKVQAAKNNISTNAVNGLPLLLIVNTAHVDEVKQCISQQRVTFLSTN
jgi:hypothetical protein